MHALRATRCRGGITRLVIKKQPFNQQQASYYDYLRRYKASELLEGRVHFDDFLRFEMRLLENEFFLAGLVQQGKTRGGAYPGLVKQQRDLRASLLIKEEKNSLRDAEGKA